MRCFIEIKDNTVEVKSGIARKTGQGYEIQEQTGYLCTADERKRISIGLRKGQTPYAPGRYEISAESFVVDQFGSLRVGRVMLVPAVAAKAA